MYNEYIQHTKIGYRYQQNYSFILRYGKNNKSFKRLFCLKLSIMILKTISH